MRLLLSVFLAGILLAQGKPTTCGKPAFPETWGAEFDIPPLSGNYKLVQAQAYFRHGDRTPWRADQCWTADRGIGVCSYTDYTEPAFGEPMFNRTKRFAFKRVYDEQNSCEVGQLTTHGYLQELNNGGILKKAYIDDIHLVSEHLHPYEVEVHSTDVHRTIDSAEAVVTGMFKIHPEKLQFVDIHIHDASTEILTVNDVAYPIVDVFMQNLTDLPEYMNWYQTKAVPLMAKIEAVMGTPVTSMDRVEKLFDCSTVHICHNVSIPFSDELAEEIALVYTQWYVWLYSYPTPAEFGRYGIGPLLNVTEQRMSDMISNGTAKKLYLSAGHDTGPILSLLVALDLPVTHWPSYASMFVFELWQSEDKQYFVRTIYDGVVQTLKDCQNTTGVASEGLCEWTSFQAMVQSFQPTSETQQSIM